MMTYKEYLKATGLKDSMFAYKWWRIEIFHQSERDAIMFMIKNFQDREI